MIIARRFRGPPTSANGGYGCGAVAGLLGSVDAEATLRAPPPLDRELGEELLDDGGVRRASLRDGATLVAEAVRTDLVLAVPPAVDFDQAERASRGYPWFEGHPFPGCFVCGPERDAVDGLRILPGAVAGRDVAAAPWVPDPSVGDADGLVETPIVWAALDCPSWFGLSCFQPWREGGVLLGRLAAHIDRRPRVGERHVAAGWFIAREGRKLTMGSALYDDAGAVLAFARATWIALRER